MKGLTKKKTELAFYLLLLVLCAVVYWDACGYPSTLREPIGSAFMPKCMAVLIALAVGSLIPGTVREIRFENNDGREKKESRRVRYDLAMRSGIILVVYGIVLTQAILPSILVTPSFLFIFILSLAGFSRTKAIWAAVVSLAFGVGLTVLFKNYLYVNLP